MKTISKIINMFIFSLLVMVTVNASQSNVFYLENQELNISESITLLDCNETPNYTLYLFDEGGYAIVNNNSVISEYALSPSLIPYENYISEDHQLIYCGPNNYIVKIDDCYYNSMTNEKIEFRPSQIQILQNAMINHSSISPLDYIGDGNQGSWSGIPESRFLRYNREDWLNITGLPYAGKCGPIAAAIMCAYYQDYHNSLVNFPDTVRIKDSPLPDNLIQYIISSTTLPSATIPSTISQGLNTFLSVYETHHNGVTSQMGYSTWNTAISKISSGRPVCVGITAVSGGTGDYKKNHWMTAYGYATINGTHYYKVINQWGF